MTKFYKALNDGMFKAIFCNKNNYDLLERLIYDAIKINVTVISAHAKELPKDNIYVKGRTLDVVCKTNDDKIINVEVNNYKTNYTHKRNFSYACQLYTNSVKSGGSYETMSSLFQINITSNNSEIDDYEVYNMIGERYHKKFIENFTICEFNVDKLKKACYNDFRFIQSLAGDKNELEQYAKDDEDMSKLNNEVNRLNDDSEFVEFLTNEEEYAIENQSIYDHGFNQGIEKGIEKNKLDIAKKLLKTNMSIQEISKITELSIEQIEKIQENTVDE